MVANLSSKRYAPILWGLLFLFCLRVLGQMLVAFAGVKFLPPMEEWFSGFLSYPILLGSQILIIILFAKICLDFSHARGFFVAPSPRLGRGLWLFGIVYLAIMIIRYVLRMSLYPHERWTGGSIPIFFHWVLASFLLTVAAYHRKAAPFSSSVSRKGWILRILVAVLIAAGMIAWIALEVAPRFIAYRLGIRPGEFAVRIERNVEMKTSDGVSLFADIYRPQRTAKTPTILVRLLYARSFTNEQLATIFCRLWAEHGYTVVMQTVRGTPPSEGTYYPLRNERHDGIETLAWLAQQPWYDGRIGTWGGSYFGYTQWVLADQSNPGPTAMMIQIASTDCHGLFYPGGAFAFESALFWAERTRGGRDVMPRMDDLERGFRTLPVTKADDAVNGNLSYFDDWATHPERDEYWAEIDGADRAGHAVAPALLMSGWYDPFLPTLLEDFKRLKHSPRETVSSNSRLIIGPWSHAETITLPDGSVPGNYRMDSVAPSIAWFDRHLDPIGALKVPAPAPVHIFVMGKNVWRDEQEWPPARAQLKSYYLSSHGHANGVSGDGLLAVNQPTENESSDTFIDDPNNPVPTAGGALLGPRAGIRKQNDIEARQDVLVYSSPPLDENLEVTGPVAAVLWVSSSAPSTDFTAKLVDVHPDGSAYNVTDGILRRKFSPGGEPVEIRVELNPTSTVFLKGHRLRLEIASTNFPHFDRNPNTGGVPENSELERSAPRKPSTIMPEWPLG